MSERKTSCARAAGKFKGTASGDGFMYVLMLICGDVNVFVMLLELFLGFVSVLWCGVVLVCIKCLISMASTVSSRSLAATSGVVFLVMC